MKSRRTISLVAAVTIAAMAVTLLYGRLASAQFGGGLGGGGQRGSALPYIQSDSVIVVVSPDGQSVSAFSLHTGVWRKQTVSVADGEQISPVLGSEVVCFQAGDRVFAFSAPRGTWSSVELQPGAKAEITVGNNMATATDGKTLHAFSAEVASWDVVEIAPKS